MPYRKRFGLFRGIFLWFNARSAYKLSKGTLYALDVPGLSHKVWLRAGTSDLMVFQQIFCDRETDFDLDLAPPYFIVDAGANIGLSSIVFASRYPRAKIVALEVDSDNYQLLCKNVGQYANVFPQEKALWYCDGYVRILNPTAEPWAFQVGNAEQNDPNAIEAISLDRILADRGEGSFSLLKIDIEGAELDLLQSSDLTWIEKTKAIAIELHDRIRPGCGAAFNRILANRDYSETQQGEYRVIQFR
jgi:FkbM family methyltransferase